MAWWNLLRILDRASGEPKGKSMYDAAEAELEIARENMSSHAHGALKYEGTHDDRERVAEQLEDLLQRHVGKKEPVMAGEHFARTYALSARERLEVLTDSRMLSRQYLCFAYKTREGWNERRRDLLRDIIRLTLEATEGKGHYGTFNREYDEAVYRSYPTLFHGKHARG